jgi:holo-[acyl-carrier protein] synthase
VIAGIGTDIVAIARMAEFWQRHGQRALEKLLAPDERTDCLAASEPARFLAKRFAAKEALGKAFGTGIRAPLLLPDIGIQHDALGRPSFVFGAALAACFAERGLSAHLSISDEQTHAIAFVILETR